MTATTTRTRRSRKLVEIGGTPFATIGTTFSRSPTLTRRRRNCTGSAARSSIISCERKGVVTVSGSCYSSGARAHAHWPVPWGLWTSRAAKDSFRVTERLPELTPGTTGEHLSGWRLVGWVYRTARFCRAFRTAAIASLSASSSTSANSSCRSASRSSSARALRQAIRMRAALIVTSAGAIA
jgi:hypothetical protein